MTEAALKHASKRRVRKSVHGQCQVASLTTTIDNPPHITGERAGRRRAVYVTMNRVKTSNEPIENASIVADGLQDWLRDVEGFEGLLMLSREGTSVGLTFWESREVAERYRPLRMQFLDRVLSTVGVELEESLDFEVTFAQLSPRLLDVAATA
jgi:hypothetical protein